MDQLTKKKVGPQLLSTYSVKVKKNHEIWCCQTVVIRENPLFDLV